MVAEYSGQKGAKADAQIKADEEGAVGSAEAFLWRVHYRQALHGGLCSAVTGAVEESADEKHGEILGKGQEEHRGKHAHKGWDGGCHNPESVNDNADEGANHDEPEGIYGEEKADIVHPHAQGIEGHIGGDRRHGQGDASHND